MSADEKTNVEETTGQKLETGDLFIEHNGVKVFEIMEDGVSSANMFTLAQEIFDVRDLVEYTNVEDENDNKAVITALIDAGILTANVVVYPEAEEESEEETVEESVEVKAEAPAEEAVLEQPEEVAPPEPKKTTTITVDRSKFLNALKTVGRAISRSSLPILEHVAFYPKGDTLYMEATDLERMITIPVPGWVNVGDGFTGPYQKLVQMLCAITNKIVEIVVTDGKDWEIKAGNDIYELEGWSLEDWPMAPDIEVKATFEIQADKLRTALLRAKDSICQDESQVVYTGMLFDTLDGNLSLAATDRHRLALYDSVTPVTGELYAIVPGSVINELAKLLDKSTDTVKASFGERHMFFEFGDITMRSRLIEGQFQTYRRVMPTSCNRRVLIGREPLLAAVKKAALIAKESSNRATIQFRNKEVEISAETGANRAKVRSIVPAILEGDDLVMAFNYNYLVDVLSTIDTKSVEFQLTGQLNAALILPYEQKPDVFKYLVMPMHVEEHVKAKHEAPVETPVKEKASAAA